MPDTESVLHSIEFPVDRKLKSRQLTIQGWCFDTTGAHLKGLRARVGDRTYTARRKRPRPFLAYRYPDIPEAGQSGFLIELTLPRGRSKVILECKKDDGRWYHLEQLEMVCPWFSLPWRRKESGHDYATWIQHYDILHAEDLVQMRRAATAWANGPLISLVLPVYNTPVKWLKRALDSVLAQVYPHWELCVADDASPEPQVRKLLQEYAAKDSRIKLVFREANGHIVAASNSALSLATGEYIALLDHDDELREHALWEMARAIQAHPEAVLIYSDEDHIDEAGGRYDPYFKPDFNYDLLLTQNFICHLATYQTALVRALGGFRAGTEGAQDWDLALRVVEAEGPGKIQHVPRVLYHWRSIEGSTARGIAEKPYATTACCRVVEEHLTRTGQPVDQVSFTAQGYVRVRRSLAKPPQVTIVIPTRNFVHLLKVCVESVLARTDYPDFELLIVDNDSDDAATLAYLASLQERNAARVLKIGGPFNYSLLNNQAVAASVGEVVCLLNNDIEIHEPDWLREMVSQAVRPDIGAVGTKLFYPDGRIQHAGVILGMCGAAGHLFKGEPSSNPGMGRRLELCQNFSAVTAACMVVEKRKYLEVGGLDEDAFKVAFNDVDFCLKLVAAGYRNLYTPYAAMSHHESASRGEAEKTASGKARASVESQVLRDKWRAFCTADPAYNPNLSLAAENGALAFPPRKANGL